MDPKQLEDVSQNIQDNEFCSENKNVDTEHLDEYSNIVDMMKLKHQHFIENQAKKKKAKTRHTIALLLSLIISAILTILSIGPEKFNSELQLALATIISIVVTASLGFSPLFQKLTDSLSFVRLGAKVRRVNDPSEAWPFPKGEVDIPSTEFTQRSKSNRRPIKFFLGKELNEQDPFSQYFYELKERLDNKAEVATATAELLLDKGTKYTRWGIFFFAASIVFWQVLSLPYFGGFHTQYIYGIVSCSALFIFIEFLSAWFLKQYRHYVDTSTYLLKVKALFDRYMLIYLTMENSASSFPENKVKQIDKLLDVLAADIKWPETYLLKSADVNFAKEAMETIANLTKELKKNTAEKEKQ